MSQNAQAQRKLQPAYGADYAVQPQSQEEAGRPTVQRDEQRTGRVEQLLLRHPSLVHEIE